MAGPALNTTWLMPLLSGLLCGLVLGALISMVFGKERRMKLEGRLIQTRTLLEEAARHAADREEEITRHENQLRNEIRQLETETADQIQRITELREDLSRANARLEEQQRSTDRIAKIQAEAMEKLTREFENLSAKALRSNNRSFLELAGEILQGEREMAKSSLEESKEAVKRLVQPLAENLEKMRSEISRIEKARSEAYGGLIEQLRGLAGDQKQLRMETSKLSQALRNPAARGRWGEIQLRRVVEMAGMIDRVDFVEQQSGSKDDIRRRPDLIVHLPGGTKIVVDAKTPMKAYLDALEASDEASRQACLKLHARHLGDRIRELSQRSYQDQFPGGPEFTVLFLPSEGLFAAALEQDPGLIERGVDQKILIATPTTLIALLRAVAYGWQQEALAENAQRISELGNTLYERLALLSEKVETLGKRINQAVGGYNEMLASLESRVFPAARRFPELGIGTGREIGSPPAVEARTRAPHSLEKPSPAAASSGEPSLMTPESHKDQDEESG